MQSMKAPNIAAGMQSLFARYRQERREGPSMEWLKDVVKRVRHDRDLVAACESILCNDVKQWYLVALNEAEGGCKYPVTRSSVVEIIRQNPRKLSRMDVPMSCRVTFFQGEKTGVIADVGSYSGGLMAHICDCRNTDPNTMTYEIPLPCLLQQPRDYD
jgi:hypothetical protein